MLLARGGAGGIRPCQRPLLRQIEIAATERRRLQSRPNATKRGSSSTGGDDDARPPGRLFSNLDDDLRHSPGSVLDAAALVAGTTIGAGVLAVPAVTAPAGFAAAAPALAGAWLFSVSSGLLLAEASLFFLCSTGRGGGSLLSLTREYLGEGPSRLAGVCYVFLHEALLVAYISRGAEVVAAGFSLPSDASDSGSSPALLLPLSAVLFTAVLGSACYALPARKLDEANSVLVAGVVVSFVALLAVALGVPPSSAPTSSGLSAAASAAASSPAFALDLRELSRADWARLPPALPVLALAFVFQNTVSVVVSSLEGDAEKVRTAVVAGTLLPLAMFLAWDAVSLGSGGGASSSSSSLDPVAALSASSPLAAPLVATFSLLALITSFVGFVLGLTDFLADALPTERAREGAEAGEQAGGPRGQTAPLARSLRSLRSLLPLNAGGRARAPVPYALTLLPPLAGAIAFPGAFLSALSAAGTYGVMALFGVLPAAVAGVARKRRREEAAARGEERGQGGEQASSSASLTTTTTTLVPGGDAVLYAVGGIAAAVMVNETLSRVMGS